MNNKRKYIMATILFLAVGAASITTSLFITGNTNISINDDFDVYFSKAVVNGTKDNSVITSSTTINFSAEMQSVGDTYTLEYDVTNASKNYDANVSVSCTNSTDNIKITNEFDTTTNLEATETRTGTLTLKLTQSVSTETTVSIKCEIDASAVERTTIADGIPADEVVLIPVTATDSSGKNLNASSYAITGTTKDTLLEKLVESGNVSSASEVDALIEVEADDFDDLATTTFDVSNIADNGDTVVILHYNETTQEWEYISEETVADGKITADFSSYSPVAFAVKKSDGTYEVVKEIYLYNLMKSNSSTETINFSVNSAISETNGIYITTETEGNVPVYYYRGSYEKVNNNLIFNNMCWKILHTTETGGVKLIYNGTPNNGQCTVQKGSTTYIGESAFNTKSNDNAYVGYMYGTVGSSTYEETHANINDSTIKIYIDSWYSNNFKDTNVISKLEDTVFCNDRSTVKGGVNNTLSSTKYGTLGYGTNATLYGAIARASFETITPSPSLKCTNTNDKFTVSTSTGNGALTYPVGLITLDEVILAGFNTYESETNKAQDKTSYETNYLYINSDYWTSSPAFMGDYYAHVGNVGGTAYPHKVSVDYSIPVRPVISLKSGTTVTGSGTTTDPYVVS